MKDVLIIIDDLRAGKIAAELHLNFAGTPGVPVKAKQTGMISSIRPVLQKMRSIKFNIFEG